MKQSAGILDNKSLGNVVSELKGNIATGCTLSVVSALFSLYAYDELKKELSKVAKFIMAQLPETTDEKPEAFKAGYKTIAEISKERIRRSAAKIKENRESTRIDTNKNGQDLFQNDENNSCKLVSISGSKLPDLGFKVFKLDSTNIKPWEVDFDLTERPREDFISNIKSDRREEDVLYEILLKYGLDLTLPITEHTIAAQKVFDIGMGALIICLSDAISLEVVEGIAKLKDELNPEIMRVVFKDSGKTALKSGELELPEEFKEHAPQIAAVLKKVSGNLNIKNRDDKKKVSLNKAVFLSPEFKELWDRIKYARPKKPRSHAARNTSKLWAKRLSSP